MEDAALQVLGLIVLYAAIFVGLLTIPIGLGGNFLLWGAVFAVALATRFETISWWGVLGAGAAVAVGEILETFLGGVAARRYGASRRGVIGAIVGGMAGGILGTLVVPVAGTLIGSFVGVAVGAISFEWSHRREFGGSLRAGWGAFLGRLGAVFVKLAIGLGIAVYLVIRTWPR
jgi:uncharacterized protein YqgC (DUF456 family)